MSHDWFNLTHELLWTLFLCIEVKHQNKKWYNFRCKGAVRFSEFSPLVSYGFSFALPKFAYIEVPKGFQHKVTPLLWPVISPSTDPDTCNTEYINILIVKYIML